MNQKPKIAVLIDWYLPGTHAGGPVRSVYSLVQLLKDRFEFYIVTTNTDLGSDRPYESVVPNKLFEHDGVRYYYFNKAALNGKALRALLDEIDPALIYLNSFWSFSFSIEVLLQKWRGKISKPVLLSPRGMLGKGALGLKQLKKRVFLFASRLARLHHGVAFHATNQQEKEDVLSEFPNATVLMASNLNALSPKVISRPKQATHLKMVFLSRVSKVKNLHFALEILKMVDSRFTITYDIHGNIEDKAYWSFCESLISQMPQHVRVNYRGEIPFDRIAEAIAGYHLLFLPTLNENYGHAIVESLLCGCPAIISDQTPWNDLETAGAGRAISLGDKTSFCKAIEWYAELDEKTFSAESENAVRYIKSKINLEATADLYTHIFYESIKNKPR